MLKSVKKFLSDSGKSIKCSAIREIRLEGESRNMMCRLDSTGRVITLFTFSKILAPGFRIGWVTGNPEILEKIVMAKQTADL